MQNVFCTRTLVKQWRVASVFYAVIFPQGNTWINLWWWLFLLCTTPRKVIQSCVVYGTSFTLVFNFRSRILIVFYFVTLIDLWHVNTSFQTGKFVIPCYLSSKKDHLIKHLYLGLKVWDGDASFFPCRKVSTPHGVAIISVSSEVIKLVFLIRICLIHHGVCKT